VRLRFDVRVKCDSKVRVAHHFVGLNVVVPDSLSWKTVPNTTESVVLGIRCFSGVVRFHVVLSYPGTRSLTGFLALIR
jgi:hypothetical protein